MLDGRVYVTGTAVSTSIDPKKGWVGTAGPFVWAVDPATRKGWHVVLADPDTRYPQGDLFVPSSGTRLFWSSRNTDGSAQKIAALDVRTRKTAWERPSPGATTSTTDLLVQGGRHGHWRDGPHSSAGGMFLHVTDRLYGVDPADGHVVWTSPKAPLKGVVASPDGRTVFAAGSQGLAVVVYALDARTGAVRWAGSIPETTGGLPVLQAADDTVYLASGGRLHALDAADGKVRWTYEFSTVLAAGPPRAFWAGGGQVYVMGTKGLVALAAGGR
ncbi:PQQ-binding-like beta-propeller repeat protein [Streptomyces sp. CC228A]|uniref:outer membrane protein assembly factor BamB family protein n=1 Tax=Streptomyces sp. CC228A TaxID=2898186 RepID=UPI0035A81841